MKRNQRTGRKILPVVLAGLLLLCQLIPVTASADGTLVGITVGDLAVPDFKAGTTSYDVDVPYRYEPNVLRTVAQPEIGLVYDDGTIEKASVTWDSAWNEETGGTAKVNAGGQDYTLNLSVVGADLYEDGGFEQAAPGGTTPAKWTNYTSYGAKVAMATAEELEPEGKPYAGNYTAKVYDANRNSDDFTAVNKPVLDDGKQYIATSVVRIVPGEPGKTDAGFSMEGRQLTKEETDADYTGEDRTKFPGTVYDEYGAKLAESFSIKIDNEWRRYYKVFTVDIQDKLKLKQDTDTFVNYYSGSWAGDMPYVLVDEMFVGELVLADIDCSYKTTVALNGAQQEIDLSAAKCVNQFGNTMGLDSASVEWQQIYLPANVTFDGGKLTVGATAQAGTVLLRGVGTLNGMKIEKIVKISLVNNDDPDYVGATLKDISIGDYSVPDLEPGTTEYTVYVPYRYEKGELIKIARPEISAVAADPDAQISVKWTKPWSCLAAPVDPDAERTDGGAVEITVSSGNVVNKYELTLKPAGNNMYEDGGMELWKRHNDRADEVMYWKAGMPGDGSDYGVKIEMKKDGGAYSGNSYLSITKPEGTHMEAGNGPFTNTDSHISPRSGNNFNNPKVKNTSKSYIFTGVVRKNSEDTETRLWTDNVANGYWKDNSASGDPESPAWKSETTPMSVTLTDNWQRYWALVDGQKHIETSKRKENFTASWTIGNYDHKTVAPSYDTDEWFFGELIPAYIDATVEGGTTITIPEQGEETKKLTTVARNQFNIGLEISDKAGFELELAENYPGVSVIPGELGPKPTYPRDSTIKVTSDAKPGTVYLRCQYSRNGMKFAKTVAIELKSGAPLVLNKADAAVDKLEGQGDYTLQSNVTQDQGTVYNYLALYEKVGENDLRLVECKVGQQGVGAPLTVNISEDKDYVIKAFAWLGDMKPLCEAGTWD